MTVENGLGVKVILCEELYACFNGFFVDLRIKDGFLNEEDPGESQQIFDKPANKILASFSPSPAYSLLKEAK